MDEYISKQKVIDYLNGYLHSLGGADAPLFDRGQRRALINAIQDISAVKAADVQPVNQWISVKDRLPEKDCLYIVCRTIYPHQIVFEARWKDSKWLSVVASNQLEYITHWMPLPEPPKDGDTNG